MLHLIIHKNGFNHIWRIAHNNAQLVGRYPTAMY